MVNLILIGPQGSGKGTQAEKIVAEFGLTHIEAGALIRTRAKKHDQKAIIIDHLANKKGQLLPDGIVLDMIYDELAQNPTSIGYLFDGFPRTLTQYQALQGLLKERNLPLSAALYLNISDPESLTRLASRRLCAQCGQGYSLLLEPNRAACTCGGHLISRPDDTESAIRERLALFHANTQPVLKAMAQDGLLKQINGEQTVDQIFTDIKQAITAFF